MVELTPAASTSPSRTTSAPKGPRLASAFSRARRTASASSSGIDLGTRTSYPRASGDRGEVGDAADDTWDRIDDLHVLEELWAAPAFWEPKAPPRRLPLVPGGPVAGGWLAFYLAVSASSRRPSRG